MTSDQEHTKRLTLYRGGATDVEIAEACFICTNAIRYWRTQQVPPLPPNPRPEVVEFLRLRLELHAQGKTDKEIAVEQRVSLTAVRDWRKRYQLPENKKRVPARGEDASTQGPR